jgi:uroporphyrinogen-III decarboxylase
MLDLAEDPAWVAGAVEQVSDAMIELQESFWECVRPELTGMEGSLCHEQCWSPLRARVYDCDVSCMVSPRTYREVFLPRHKRIYRYAKELTGAHIFMHCCGGVYELIPDLIDAGVEVLNPVQTGARRMEPARLKREFGRDVTFWGGGCDTQGLLATGTPAEVREDVGRRLEVFMPGGGYVWNQVHNVLADVPPANIEAMLDAAYEYGRYV